MSAYVSDILHSHPEWPLYYKFLLHHWSEKSNFCTIRFVSLKQTFCYTIWPHSWKCDFRCFLCSSVSSPSRVWMVLVMMPIFICSTHKFSCPIHFPRSTDIKVMSTDVSDILQSNPEWHLYHKFLLPHLSEKSKFCTNRFVLSKQRFWYIIWSHSSKYSSRCPL